MSKGKASDEELEAVVANYAFKKFGSESKKKNGIAVERPGMK